MEQQRSVQRTGLGQDLAYTVHRFFSARQHIFLARYMLSPVRLSVRYTAGSAKKVEVRIMQFHRTLAPSL